MNDMRRWARAQWDRIAGASAMAAGGVAIVLGWFGVSGTTDTAAQLSYLVSGGLGGLFLLGVGATLWLSADLRDEWRLLAEMEDRIVERLRAVDAEPGEPTVLPDGPIEPAVNGARLRMVAGNRPLRSRD